MERRRRRDESSCDSERTNGAKAASRGGVRQAMQQRRRRGQRLGCTTTEAVEREDPAKPPLFCQSRISPGKGKLFASFSSPFPPALSVQARVYREKDSTSIRRWGAKAARKAQGQMEGATSLPLTPNGRDGIDQERRRGSDRYRDIRVERRYRRETHFKTIASRTVTQEPPSRRPASTRPQPRPPTCRCRPNAVASISLPTSR